jgi:hypothetical protein
VQAALSFPGALSNETQLKKQALINLVKIVLVIELVSAHVPSLRR